MVNVGKYTIDGWYGLHITTSGNDSILHPYIHVYIYIYRLPKGAWLQIEKDWGSHSPPRAEDCYELSLGRRNSEHPGCKKCQNEG